MLFYSLNNNADKVNFEQAAINGLAPDNGLYFPAVIPKFGSGLLGALPFMDKVTLGVEVLKPFVGNAMPESELRRIVAETVDFDIPLKQISEQVWSLELFHGPTLAFKDVGARFMSRCLGYFLRNQQRKVVVLVATSGDTGGAVANGFQGVDGVEVVVLYPAGKVSSVQESQINVQADNVKALKIDGTFDDCQQMVKKAFADKDLNQKLFLTSANSINVARWLPQQLYYFYALQQWRETVKPFVSVPSGNFGNISAGILASRSRLPINRFVAACNANDVVPKYFENGVYQAQQAKATISNAMDVGDPSNFVRTVALYDNNTTELKKHVVAQTIDDAITLSTIKKVYTQYDYVLDPHAAVGYAALKRSFKSKRQKGIVLATAHPVKFMDVIRKAIGEHAQLAALEEQIASAKAATPLSMKADYDSLKAYLIENA